MTYFFGRRILAQVELLSQFGYGDEITQWSKYKASQVIEKELAKRNQQPKA